MAGKLIDLLRVAGEKEGMSHKVAIQRVRTYILMNNIEDTAEEIAAIKEVPALRHLFEAGVPSPLYLDVIEAIAKLEEEGVS